jgi:tRNA/tmRNA/rRNA uracil-C5-methylase (TrmA/RlmC/RlmD family)
MDDIIYSECILQGAELEHLAKELSRLDKKLLYISCDPGSGAKAAN